jgi:hypothetical protein
MYNLRHCFHFTAIGTARLFIQDIIYLCQYFHRAERFYDVFVSSDILAAFLLVYLSLGGKHNDVGLHEIRVVFDGAADVIAVDFRHYNIEEQDIGRHLLDFSERFSTISGQKQRITFILKEIGESCTDIFIIVRYKYFLLFHSVIPRHDESIRKKILVVISFFVNKKWSIVA